jgi:hypothetical protein
VNFFGFMGMEEPRKQELAPADRKRFDDYCEDTIAAADTKQFIGRLTVPDLKFLKAMRIKVFE